MKPLRVLIIEDSPDDADLLVLELARAGFEPAARRVASRAELERALAEPWDIVISDYDLPGFDAPAALAMVREKEPDVPFVIVSGVVSEAAAVACMKAGAQDFVSKNNLARLASAVSRELLDARTRRERREALERLRQAEERYRLIVESVRDYAMFMLDPSGRVTSWNPGAERLTGWSEAEVTGRSHAIFYPEDARARGEPEAHLEIARREGSHHEERQRVRKDGSIFWAESSLHAIEKASADQGFSVVLRDITERKRLVDDLREAVRVRDEFLAIASHELRTPLTSLKLQVQSLLAKRESPNGPKLDEKLRLVERQVGRLNDLIGGMLDVLRITSGKMTLSRERVDLVDVVRDVVARAQPTIERAGYVVEVKADGPVVGHWDRLRLETVAANLLSNALKYGERKPVEIGVSAENGRARLTVRDQGIGIPPEAQARIFERFERAVPIRHFGGLGLGLWITRQIVEAHGGAIRLESRQGGGTTFTVELPM